MCPGRERGKGVRFRGEESTTPMNDGDGCFGRSVRYSWTTHPRYYVFMIWHTPLRERKDQITHGNWRRRSSGHA